MEYRRLGRTGVTVSSLCLGCMSYGTPGWDVHPWVLSRDDAMPFFRRAADAGVNFLDTADHYSYGASEQVVGEAVRKFFTRNQTVVATKVGLPMGPGANQTGLSRKHIVEAVEGSLRRLGFDHIDILFTHRFDAGTEIEEVIVALDQLVRQGKVVYLGASSSWAWQFVRAREMQKANGLARFAVMQNFYNLVYREEEREMIPYCLDEGVAIMPWSPLARGFLAGNAAPAANTTARNSADGTKHALFGSDVDHEILRRVIDIARRLDAAPAQIALAWLLHKPGVVAPIIGATQIGQFDEATGAIALRLDTEAIAHLEEAYVPRVVAGHT